MERGSDQIERNTGGAKENLCWAFTVPKLQQCHGAAYTLNDEGNYVLNQAQY